MESIILNEMIDNYLSSAEEQKEFISIVSPIINHKEFQKRLSNSFLHHSDITLGEHLFEDALCTYKLLKRKEKKKKVNIVLGVKIALFHDLYTISWQNNKKFTKVRKFSHKHGFRHPIEAAINSAYWYKEEFKDLEDANTIIDGIIHHMYPLPVTRIKNIEDIELRNYDTFLKLPKNIQNIIIKSTNRGKIAKFSFARSKYYEGRIMSKADKKVSFHQIKNLSSFKALLTGNNKSLDNKQEE